MIIKKLLFPEGPEAVRVALKAHNRGERVLCPVCGAELEIIATREEARRMGRHAGVYCPVDPKHVRVCLNLGYHEDWERIDRLVDRERRRDSLTLHSRAPGPMTQVGQFADDC